MIKNVLLSSLLALTAISGMSQITLGSRRAVHDGLTDTWLCCVPESVFGTDFSATFATSESWTDITLDGRPIRSGSNVVFQSVDGQRRYHLEAVQNDTTIIKGDICFTFNPIFEFNGTFTNDYQVITALVSLPESQAPVEMLCKLKHRGGSTNTPSKLKRNYHIKFLNPDSTKMDRKFFGLRNDNSWILDAGQVDMLRIRNRVTTELWLDMCRAPYYADREPKALSGVRGDFIEVFLNGNYNGFYAMTEAMDRKQLKLVKYDETNKQAPFHGMLWKSKANDPVTKMTAYSDYNNRRSKWSNFEVKYPDPDDVMPTQYATLADAVRFVAESSNEEFAAHVGEYFDLPVIMDYWVLINAVLGVDSGVKNIYWAVYDREQDKKLTLAVWDLDCTFGQNWINQPLHNTSVVGPTVQLMLFCNLFLRLHEINPDNFIVKATERYHELRQTVLSQDSLKRRFNQRLEPLYRSGAIARETERWTKTTDISLQKLDFPSEMAYIEQWIDRRLPYLDRSRFLPYTKGDINRDGQVDVADINRLINHMIKGDSPVWYEDVNEDNMYDIGDLNAIINIIVMQKK